PNHAARKTGCSMTSRLVYVEPTKSFWKSWTSSGYWKITVPSPSAGDGLTRECETPHARRGTATTNPAIGPATAMSNSWRLSRIGSRMRMNAPIVPPSDGDGEEESGEGALPA